MPPALSAVEAGVWRRPETHISRKADAATRARWLAAVPQPARRRFPNAEERKVSGPTRAWAKTNKQINKYTPDSDPTEAL